MPTTVWDASHFPAPAELGCDTSFFDSDAYAHLLLSFCKFCDRKMDLMVG